VDEATEMTEILNQTRDSIQRLVQSLQSGLVDDKDTSFEYEDANGQVQGPFTAKQLSEWNNAGYLDKRLHVRKRSTIKGMNGGAFVELEKLYDEAHGERPFEQDSRTTISNSIEMLDKLIQAMRGGHNAEAVVAMEKTSYRPDVLQQPEEKEKNTSGWIQMSDPDSGDIYYYNTVSGQSSWETPQHP
jgi:hypothetical protein